MLSEVEGPQQDIESQQVHEHIPHVLWQPQVIGINHLRQQVSRAIRRRCLVGRHTSEEGIGPTTALTGLLQVLDALLSGAAPSRGIMTIEDTSLDVGREEVSESQNGE